MPIDKIITFAFGVLGTLLLLHGPFHLQEEMRKLEIEILRETARTDNWGSPDIFAGHGTKSHIHATGRLSPVRPLQR
jgi:hypothetical protein